MLDFSFAVLYNTPEDGAISVSLMPKSGFFRFSVDFSGFRRDFIGFQRIFRLSGGFFAAFGRDFPAYRRLFAAFGREFPAYGRLFRGFGRHFRGFFGLEHVFCIMRTRSEVVAE